MYLMRFPAGGRPVGIEAVDGDWACGCFLQGACNHMFIFELKRNADLAGLECLMNEKSYSNRSVRTVASKFFDSVHPKSSLRWCDLGFCYPKNVDCFLAGVLDYGRVVPGLTRR